MQQLYYAIKNRDNNIRRNSSSGGIFFTLAKNIIKKNGIVYGAIYDDNINVVHARATTEQELKKFSGSKYVQSDLNTCLEKIKQDLEDNKLVLFSGTPCQINAVKVATKKLNTSNLFLLDLVCYGTPQANFFNDYKIMLEDKYKSKISSINMRYKDEKFFEKNLKNKSKSLLAVGQKYMKVCFENNKSYIEKRDYDEFYYLFDFFVKKGCFKCPFSNLDRNSDITIGDFHEFNYKLDEFNDQNGVSVMIISTEKGEKLFKEEKENFEFLELKKNDILQPALEHPAIKPKLYDEFRENYSKYGFDYVVKKYMKNNKKIYIKKFIDKIGLFNYYLYLKNILKNR